MCSSPTTSRSSGISPTGSRSCISARSPNSGRRTRSMTARPTPTPRRCSRRSPSRPHAAGQARTDRPHRRCALTGESAVRLPLPHPLLAGPGPVPDRGARTHPASRRRRTASLRLPLRRGPCRHRHHESRQLGDALRQGHDRHVRRRRPRQAADAEALTEPVADAGVDSLRTGLLDREADDYAEHVVQDNSRRRPRLRSPQGARLRSHPGPQKPPQAVQA